ELSHGHRARRDRAVAVAAQVGGDDAETVTEGGRLRRPHAAVEGVTVEEHHDGAVAGVVVGEVDGGHGPDGNAWRLPARRPGPRLPVPPSLSHRTDTSSGAGGAAVTRSGASSGGKWPVGSAPPPTSMAYSCQTLSGS